MTFDEYLRLLNINTSIGYLRCKAQFLDGVVDAINFARESKSDMNALIAKIAETREKFVDPSFMSGPMKLGASPRTYREGFIHGLEIALNAIDTYGTYDSD